MSYDDDELGADDLDALLGATEILGAAPAPRNVRGPGGGTARVQETQGRLQRILAGIERKVVAASGGNAEVKINVSDPFRADRVVIGDNALDLDLISFLVGTKNLIINGDPVSCYCFARDAIGTELRGYTAQPGVGLTLRFSNPTAAPITTSGGVFGVALA